MATTTSAVLGRCTAPARGARHWARSMKWMGARSASTVTPPAMNTARQPQRSTRKPATTGPAPRSAPSAGSATATPEIMKGGANCEAAIAGTSSGWASRITRGALFERYPVLPHGLLPQGELALHVGAELLGRHALRVVALAQ